MLSTHYGYVLRQNGLLYGTRFVWSRYLHLSLQILSNIPQLTVVGMKHSDERVALQAVEFWSTVCEEEVELAIELQEVRFYTHRRAGSPNLDIRLQNTVKSQRPNLNSLQRSLFPRLYLSFYFCLHDKKRTRMMMSGMCPCQLAPAWLC